MPRAAHAGGGAATEAYEGVREGPAVDLHGLLDVYGQGAPDVATGLPRYRAFDLHANALSVDVARVTVAHRPGSFGFRLDLTAGDMADAYMQSDPAYRRYPVLARATSYAEQAFVTAAAAGGALAFDVGKFETPVGFEDNETPTNWQYSRSLLFTLAEPTYHTGLRATYAAAGGSLGLSALWLNGWNTNVVDGNGMRSFGAAATWRPRAAPLPTELALVYVGGLERAPTQLGDPALGFRNAFDAYAVVAPRPWLELAATADYGTDTHGGGVTWWGVSGYVRCHVLPWLAVALRGEHLDDGDGFLTGTRQRIAGVTGTLEAHDHVGDVAVRAWIEYRRDQSDERVFGDASRRLLHQDSWTLALSAAF